MHFPIATKYTKVFIKYHYRLPHLRRYTRAIYHSLCLQTSPSTFITKNIQVDIPTIDKSTLSHSAPSTLHLHSNLSPRLRLIFNPRVPDNESCSWLVSVSVAIFHQWNCASRSLFSWVWFVLATNLIVLEFL